MVSLTNMAYNQGIWTWFTSTTRLPTWTHEQCLPHQQGSQLWYKVMKFKSVTGLATRGNRHGSQPMVSKHSLDKKHGSQFEVYRNKVYLCQPGSQRGEQWHDSPHAQTWVPHPGDRNKVLFASVVHKLGYRIKIILSDMTHIKHTRRRFSLTRCATREHCLPQQHG